MTFAKDAYPVKPSADLKNGGATKAARTSARSSSLGVSNIYSTESRSVGFFSCVSFTQRSLLNATPGVPGAQQGVTNSGPNPTLEDISRKYSKVMKPKKDIYQPLI